MHRVFALVLVLLSLVLVAPSMGAQDATPAASPSAVPCDAPSLPPGTPTPFDDATPMAEMATPASGEADASPAAGDAAADDMGMPLEVPAGTPITGDDAAAAEMALENLFNCINSGDFLAVGALLTDDFIQFFLGVPTIYDVPSTFEGVQPVEIRSLDNPLSHADGSISIDVVYTGLFNGPGVLAAERWYFVEEDGVYKLSTLTFGLQIPESVLPGAVIIDVQMVDYAFALSEYTVPANTPVIFRTTNNSGTGAPHVNVVVTFAEGTTAQELIQDGGDLEEESIGFFGAVFLEPGQSGDLAFEGLEPGIYFLVCDVTTEDGTPHYELGMVTQITVE